MAVIKESSDTLTEPPSLDTAALSARRTKTLSDYVALAVATCGVGFIPIAPGTWGSAVGVAIYLWITSIFDKIAGWSSVEASTGRRFDGDTIVLASFPEQFVRITSLILVSLFVTLIGIWAANKVEATSGRKDPGIVVIDEVAGQLIALTLVPRNSPLWVILIGFIAFRLFDIWKPYPIRRLEALESGLGVMADDVLAGVYAAVLVAVIICVAMF
jgi:phosphatidylglycerophosphatase A